MTQRTDTYDTEHWQLVPKRLTPEMTHALLGSRSNVAGVWKDLLAVSPILPASVQSFEPVAWTFPDKTTGLKPNFGKGWTFSPIKLANTTMPLYTTPPSAEGARDAILEEAASMCDSYARTKHNNGQSCAQAIRALKSKKEAQ